MNTLFRNRYLDALAKSLLCFVVMHWIVLVATVIRDGDVRIVNVFTILDIDKLWPTLGSGIYNHLLSAIFAITVFFLVLRFLTPKKSTRVQ